MFGFVAQVEGSPTATKDGRPIAGTREQIEALMPGWEVRDLADDPREQLPVEEWVAPHLRWDAESGAWVRIGSAVAEGPLQA